MGYYINPRDESKESWLVRHGLEISQGGARELLDGSGPMLPVCLVSNPGFTAAAIAYSTSEFDHFTLPQDTRKKRWFAVSVANLREVNPDFAARHET